MCELSSHPFLILKNQYRDQKGKARWPNSTNGNVGRQMSQVGGAINDPYCSLLQEELSMDAGNGYGQIQSFL